MELTKRKYSRAETERLLSALAFDYENELNRQKQRITELIEQNEEYEKKLSYYLEKETLITETIKNATKKSQEILDEANLLYRLEVERLKLFSTKLNEFCEKNLKNFSVEKGVSIKTANSRLKSLLNSDKATKTKIIDAEKIVSNTKINGDKPNKTTKKRKKNTTEKPSFNPRKIIEAYIASTESGAFNMDDVLNPKDIDLEALCCEMGLIKEK